MTTRTPAALAVTAVRAPERQRRRTLPAPPRAVSAAVPSGRGATLALLLVITAIGAFLRLWEINRFGLNSDEAVYAGQAGSIAGDGQLRPFFPVFRAHPLLFHSVLSLAYGNGVSDVLGRIVASAFGIASIPLVHLTGARMYGRRTGLLAAALIAVMPYHVVVSRQILLDGPMTFFATLTLYLLVRYAASGRPAWLYATAAGLALTFLTKETGVVMVGAIYAFLALSPSVRLRTRHAVIAGSLAVAIMAAYPIAVALSARSQTAQNFLVWQLFRRSNHSLLFYPTTLVHAVGPLLVLVAAMGIWRLRAVLRWREVLLVAWVLVPTAFFELWPVKGFPYLLPIAPALALLAARALVTLAEDARGRGGLVVTAALATVLFGTLLTTSWSRVTPSPGSTFLAGSGGVPGGRAAGRWIAEHVPQGAQMLSIGPSMANILEFYGHRRVYGLSVSPNPLHRNPVYVAVDNPDLLIRDSDVQYVVWDAYSATRSTHFSDRLLRYRDRYHGRLAHVETIALRDRDGGITQKPVIAIWEVHP